MDVNVKKVIVSITVLGGLGIASEILYGLYKRVTLASKEKKHGQFIFFPDKGILQGNFAHNTNSNSTPMEESLFFKDPSLNNNNGDTDYNKSLLATSTSLIHLINLIDTAQQTLVVCVMTITCRQLADAIIRAKNRGVSVRVVVDSTMVETNGCQLSRLRSSNILSRSMSCPGGLMHNKFAVVDALVESQSFVLKNSRRYNNGAKSLTKSCRGTAMSGSFNWTWTAVISNEENVFISNDVDFVNPLADRFEKIWKELQ